MTPDEVTTILSDFQYLAAHYFSHPSYLKVGKGRPVVFFYSSLALTPVPAIQQVVASLRKAMFDAGFNVYLIGDEYSGGAAVGRRIHSISNARIQRSSRSSNLREQSRFAT